MGNRTKHYTHDTICPNNQHINFGLTSLENKHYSFYIFLQLVYNIYMHLVSDYAWSVITEYASDLLEKEQIEKEEKVIHFKF